MGLFAVFYVDVDKSGSLKSVPVVKNYHGIKLAGKVAYNHSFTQKKQYVCQAEEITTNTAAPAAAAPIKAISLLVLRIRKANRTTTGSKQAASLRSRSQKKKIRMLTGTPVRKIKLIKL